VAHLDDISEASPVDAVEDIANFLDAEATQPEEEEEELEGGELDAADSEEAQDESDEPGLPAIDPPVSWGTDAKERFAQLPVELQEFVSEREAQRDKAVQRATTEAAQAKRSASIEAETVFAERQRQYASEVEYLAGQLAPQRPNPALVQSNPALFYQMQAEYEEAIVQQRELQHRAMTARQEAGQREQFAANEQLQADMAVLAEQIPDWNDTEKRTALLTEVGKVGAELGYSSDLMAEATAQDVLALKKAAEWKSKAAKYDALQKGKMDKVRAAKSLPKVVRPGVAPTRGEISSARSQQSWQNVKQATSKETQAAAFADYLETSGHL
jgi:hypothetical protein